jgi:hypothetical protein
LVQCFRRLLLQLVQQGREAQGRRFFPSA